MISRLTPHNTEGHTEAQGGKGICPRSPSHIDTNVGLNFWPPGSSSRDWWPWKFEDDSHLEAVGLELG